jgi:hypothetical protein
MAVATVASETRSELIRKKAFELYLERGGAHGQDLTDWLRAERIIDTELGRAAKTQPRHEPAGVLPGVQISSARAADPAAREAVSNDRNKRRTGW